MFRASPPGGFADPRKVLHGLTLGAAPAVIFVAHFFYGAYLPTPALVLSCCGGLGLLFALSNGSIRSELGELKPVILLVLLFSAVLLVAALTQTPWLPGGPHPLWAWAGLPGAKTIDISATRIEMMKLAGAACFFVIGCCLGLRTERARQTLGLILIIGSAYAAISLLLFVTRTEIGWSTSRLLGGFYTPNTAATVLGMLTVLGAAWQIRTWRRGRGATLFHRLVQLAPSMAATLLFAAILCLTASRAGLGCTILALAILVILDGLTRSKIRLSRMTVAALIILAATVVFALVNSTILDRFADLGLSAQSRQSILAAHWPAIQKSPWFGYGLGTFPLISNQLMTTENYAALAQTVVMHNTYVQWIEEAGIVGAAPMFALVGVIVMVTAWRTIRRAPDATLLAGLLAASALILCHAAVDVSLQTPSVVAFWSCLLGLGFAWSQAPTRRRSRQTSGRDVNG